MGGRLQSAKGFTLLELIVVMVVAAAAVGLVAPRFAAALPGLELKSAATDLASALRYARGRAIAMRREIAVVIDVDAGTYRIEGDADERVRELGRQIEINLLTGRSELRSPSVGALSFFADGASTGGQVALSAGDRSFEIDGLWLTGRVTVL